MNTTAHQEVTASIQPEHEAQSAGQACFMATAKHYGHASMDWGKMESHIQKSYEIGAAAAIAWEMKRRGSGLPEGGDLVNTFYLAYHSCTHAMEECRVSAGVKAVKSAMLAALPGQDNLVVNARLLQDAEARAARAESACAAMRAALEQDALRGFNESDPPVEVTCVYEDGGRRTQGPVGCREFFEVRKAALSTDAGKDFAPRAELENLESHHMAIVAERNAELNEVEAERDALKAELMAARTALFKEANMVSCMEASAAEFRMQRDAARTALSGAAASVGEWRAVADAAVEHGNGFKAELNTVDATLGNCTAFDGCKTREGKISLAMQTAKRADVVEKEGAALKAELASLRLKWESDEPGNPGHMHRGLYRYIVELTGAHGSSKPSKQLLQEFVERLKADSQQWWERCQENLAGVVSLRAELASAQAALKLETVPSECGFTVAFVESDNTFRAYAPDGSILWAGTAIFNVRKCVEQYREIEALKTWLKSAGWVNSAASRITLATVGFPSLMVHGVVSDIIKEEMARPIPPQPPASAPAKSEEKWTAEKDAFARGEVIEYRNGLSGDWRIPYGGPDWTADEYRIKPAPAWVPRFKVGDRVIVKMHGATDEIDGILEADGEPCYELKTWGTRYENQLEPYVEPQPAPPLDAEHADRPITVTDEQFEAAQIITARWLMEHPEVDNLLLEKRIVNGLKEASASVGLSKDQLEPCADATKKEI